MASGFIVSVWFYYTYMFVENKKSCNIIYTSGSSINKVDITLVFTVVFLPLPLMSTHDTCRLTPRPTCAVWAVWALENIYEQYKQSITTISTHIKIQYKFTYQSIINFIPVKGNVDSEYWIIEWTIFLEDSHFVWFSTERILYLHYNVGRIHLSGTE